MRHHEAASSMAMRPREYQVMFDLEGDYWWYRGLRVLLRQLLARYAPDPRTRVLDAGCGTGANLQLLLQHTNAIGIDIAAEAIELCLARGVPPDRALVASLLELPFPDSYFELAFSFDVICNIEDDTAAFAEIGRVLKRGGRMIAQLPAYRFLWSAHDIAVGHKHRYTLADLTARVSGAGLFVERATYLNTLLFPVEMLARFARRGAQVDGTAHSDLIPLPRPVNAVLARLYEMEMRAAPRLALPYGLSILIIARKD